MRDRPSRGLFLRRFDRDVGLVLAAFIVALAIENVAIGLGYRSEFVGAWEMGSARLNLSPIALALSLPIALSMVMMARLAEAKRAWGVAILGALGGAAIAFGVSTGRKMVSIGVRAPFVCLVALIAGVLALLLARQLPRMRPAGVAALGATLAVGGWLADAFVLPRLYPAFHLALFFLTLMAWAGTSLLLQRTRVGGAVALLAILITAGSIAWAPDAAKRVGRQDNLRRVMLERAPILRRSVAIATKLSPPPRLEDDTATEATLSKLRDRKGERSLDWHGHDIVLVTIDALRADHVSSYGYARKTTPNIDALAARGARFEHAYCPTPHTSYSIASMMTGTYMKPLLALGDDANSPAKQTGETWPVQLRRYGYRTAAFYPPAVFFIDEHRFRRMREESLGFEYKKEEFATPDVRRGQIERYLSLAPKDKPLFLWVHLFEPHEPYEMHREFPFEGDPRVDAYDSEIATADAFVGDIVKLVGEKRPPGTVFIVSADHGEEHGDHGGRYHGTTVYEEQVRVPLIVVGPKIAPHVVQAPVQTIDLLPTSLAALDVPTPPRLRGRDLGPALAGTEAATEEGLAFAETDDYTLVARGADRLVCARKVGSCTLFDVARDPAEKQPIADRAARVTELRKLTAAIERETGKMEASAIPDALRRGLQGDRDAAEDVAPLLDDARVDIRRLAARCAFKLKAPEMAVQLERSEARDDDAEVRRWSSLALVRLGRGDARSGAGGTRADVVFDAILRRGTHEDEKYAAALAIAEHGDGRGEPELLGRWTASFSPEARTPGELDEAREMLGAFAALHSKNAAPVLVRSLPDVRLRPYVVEALGEIGDMRAKDPLLRIFSEERYVHLRALEARTLFKLGAREKLMPALTRFAGTPEPLTEAISVARDAKLLSYDRGGWVAPPPPKGQKGPPGPESVSIKLRLPTSGSARMLVLGLGKGPLTGTIEGVAIPETAATAGNVYVMDLEGLRMHEVQLNLAAAGGIGAVWIVPRADEIPPPPPQAWDAGASSDEIPP